MVCVVLVTKQQSTLHLPHLLRIVLLLVAWREPQGQVRAVKEEVVQQSAIRFWSGRRSVALVVFL